MLCSRSVFYIIETGSTFSALKRFMRLMYLDYDHDSAYVSSTSQLTAYTDADWHGCPVTHRLHVRSKSEAEYRGVANVVAETAWIRNFISVLNTSNDIHFFENMLLPSMFVLHVPSRFQYADIFTKGLPTALFLEFRSSLNVRRSPAHTEGEY
ncbi:ribonuclease H-like domain-containing protein [Tanacetum coccineum]